MMSKRWSGPRGSYQTAALSLLMAAAPAWGAEQIYLLQEQAEGLTAETRYSFQSIGTVNGARMVAVPQMGGHVLVLTDQGRVWTWGSNSQGQLATGDTRRRDGWGEVEGLSDIIGVAAGTLHSVALKQDGTIWTWGANDQGQLGDRSLVGRPRAGIVDGLRDVSMVAAGGTFTLALRDDGTVWAFGSNWSEIVPGDARRIITEPAQVHGLPAIETVATIGNRGYAKDQQGRIWVWGKSAASGAISTPRELTGAPAALLEELEVRFSQSDRTTLQMDWRGNRQRTRLANVAGCTLELTDGKKKISYKFDGSVVDADWGWAIALITSSDAASLALAGRPAGRSCFNTPEHGRPTTRSAMTFSVSLPRSAVAPPGTLTASQNHSLVIKSDATVRGWGQNEYGELGDGTLVGRNIPVGAYGLSGVTYVSTGWLHSLAVKSDGTVLGWGSNSNGQLCGLPGIRPTPAAIPGLSNIVAAAAGGYHSLFLTRDGFVFACGKNDNGQLGRGDSVQYSTPVFVLRSGVSPMTGVIAIAAGQNFSLAVKDGTAWGWGANSVGQLGDGTRLDRPYATQIPGISGGVAAIAAGSSHSIFLGLDGVIWTCGLNLYGQLGDGTTTTRLNIVRAGNLSNMIAIGAGDNHTLAVGSDGTVWAWGYNQNGQLGDGTSTNRLLPVQTVLLTTATAVAGGTSHSVALLGDGSIYAWGDNTYAQIGNGTNNSSSVPQVTAVGSSAILPPGPPPTPLAKRFSAGRTHVLAIKSDGTLWSWGQNAHGELGDGTTTTRATPMQALGLTNVVAVSAGADYSLALKSDGTVWSWGSNYSGQLGNGTSYDSHIPQPISNFSGVAAMSACYSHSLALKGDGTVWAWGENSSGQLGNDSNAPYALSPVQTLQYSAEGGYAALTGVGAIACGGNSSFALKNDGTLWAWPSRSRSAEQLQGLTGVVAIAAGGVVAFLRTDGTVWSMGSNFGLLGGGGSLINLAGLVRASDLVNVVAISVGDDHTVAVRSDGTVWSWGGNFSGQLGDGTTTDRSAPVQVTGLFNVLTAVAGLRFSMSLRSNGTTQAWGTNDSGQFGIATPASSSVPVGSSFVAFPGAVPGDFNQDGLVDVIWQDQTSGQAQIFLLGGTSAISVINAANLTASNTWRIAAVADFNGDGRPDIVWQDPANGQSQVWFLGGANGNQITGAVSLGGPNAWRIAAVGDFNKDGHPDVIWQDQTSGYAQIWYLGGSNGTTVIGAANLTNSNTWRIVGVGDFNNDGAPDVVWQDPNTGATQVWYLGGSGGDVLIGAANVTLSNSWRVAALADFNGDGSPDLIYQDPNTGASQVWLLNNTTIVGINIFSGANSWRIAGPK